MGSELPTTPYNFNTNFVPKTKKMNNLSLQNSTQDRVRPIRTSLRAFWRFEDNVCQLLKRWSASVRANWLIDKTHSPSTTVCSFNQWNILNVFISNTATAFVFSTPSRFQIINFLCFEWKFLFKDTSFKTQKMSRGYFRLPSMKQERQLLTKLSIEWGLRGFVTFDTHGHI